jgi:hypothetical protein
VGDKGAWICACQKPPKYVLLPAALGLVRLFPKHMDWIGLEKNEKSFDLFGFQTHPISLNPHGLRANRTSPYTGPGHGKRAPGGGGGGGVGVGEKRREHRRGWRLLCWVRRPFQFSPSRDREPSAVSSSPTAAERESKAGTPSPVHHSTLPTHGRIYSSPNTRGRTQ